MSEAGPSYAVAVAVGPKPAELDRLRDLADAIAFHEPSARGTLILIDDAPEPRGLDRLLSLPPALRVASLHHPRHGEKVTYRVGKGIVSAVLLALGHAQRETDARFVLKLDTDSLVIGPFVERLGALFAGDASLAVAGAHTRTPTGERRSWAHHVKLIRAAARPPLRWREPLRSLARRRSPAVARLNDLLTRAAGHGYDIGEHCMGGGYAVSRAFLDRAAANGWFDEPQRWTSVDLPEDVVVGLHARALGMRLADFVSPGEVFGVKYVGLPMPPAELVSRGYAVTHAVKNDPTLGEAEIRAYFRGLRGPQTPPAR